MPATKKRTAAADVEVQKSAKQSKQIKVAAVESNRDSPPSEQIKDIISMKSPFRTGPHASLAAADATLSCLDSFAKAHETKAMELVFLARNKHSKDKDVKKGIANVIKLHSKESTEILAPEVDVSSFNHGYWSGILAFARLTGGVIHAAEESAFVETKGPLPSAAVMRQLAIDSFPDLHV